ncbi:MAG: hypothetical protein JW929_09640 [Anaerolineales bacterium]|nr:hypothetical protein [Anaerolineales bacterium]
MLNPRILFASFLLPLFLAACGSNPSASPAASGSSPTPPPATEASPSQIAKNTPIPTTPAETPAPAGLNASGPHVLFDSGQGIWIANPDGGFPTRMSEYGTGKCNQDLHDAVAPGGDSLAVAAIGKTGIDLLLVDIPGGSTTTVARLLDITRLDLALDSLSLKAFAYYAITEFPNLAWRPGQGGVLAYVNAILGPTTDLFTYDREREESRRHAEDPSQAIHPIWSPDGDYLLFFGVNWLPPYGQTYVTFDPMQGFWAVRLSDGEMIPQPAPLGTHLNFVGWRDGTHYLVYDSDTECIARDLRAVDLVTGEAAPVLEGCLHARPAWSPGNRTAMVSVGPDCECGISPGTYLLPPDRPEPIRLMEEQTLEVFWLAESGVFYAYPAALFSADGESRYDPPAAGASYHPAVSAAGHQAWEVVADRRGRVAVKPAGADWREILAANVSLLIWDAVSGDTLLIALENGDLYSAAAPDFLPRLTGRIGWNSSQAVWVEG